MDQTSEMDEWLPSDGELFLILILVCVMFIVVSIRDAIRAGWDDLWA
jgi:hypothetical protein